MICNVSTEERKENLVHTMIQRNEYLQSIDDVTKKIELFFVKDAAGETKHYILKCHPEVRGLIFKNGDRIKLEWGVYKVRARYNYCVELSNARINRFSDGFFPSTSHLWNSLPSAIFPASFNLPSFKRQVYHHLRDQMA